MNLSFDEREVTWIMLTTLSKLSHSALSGCSTCSILYAGLLMSREKAAWEVNKEEIEVKIKDRTGYVAVVLPHETLRYDFYASPDSSQLLCLIQPFPNTRYIL